MDQRTSGKNKQTGQRGQPISGATKYIFLQFSYKLFTGFLECDSDSFFRGQADVVRKLVKQRSAAVLRTLAKHL